MARLRPPQTKKHCVHWKHILGETVFAFEQQKMFLNFFSQTFCCCDKCLFRAQTGKHCWTTFYAVSAQQYFLGCVSAVQISACVTIILYKHGKYFVFHFLTVLKSKISPSCNLSRDSDFGISQKCPNKNKNTIVHFTVVCLVGRFDCNFIPLIFPS